MPFDAITVSKGSSLTDRLAMFGIITVPLTDLEAHKAEQVRLHPRSWLLSSRPYLSVGGIVMVAYLLCLSQVANAIAHGCIAMMLTFFLVGLYSNFKPLPGVARWIEKHAPSYNDCLLPPTIRAIVAEVRTLVPEGRIVVGELVQDQVVLDPYVIIDLNGERACLGIWIDKTVLAAATFA